MKTLKQLLKESQCCYDKWHQRDWSPEAIEIITEWLEQKRQKRAKTSEQISDDFDDELGPHWVGTAWISIDELLKELKQ